jgi:hypothetical protein
MAVTVPEGRVPGISTTSEYTGTYGRGQVQPSGTRSGQLVLLHGFAADAFGPDMTDLVLSDPDLVAEVLDADRELREGRGRFLSVEEAFEG